MLVQYSEKLENALEDFLKQEKKICTAELYSIIENIAKTGMTCYPWRLLKELLYFKINEIFEIFENQLEQQTQQQQTGTNVTSTSSSSSPTPSSPNTTKTNINSSGNSLSPMVGIVNGKDDEMMKIKNQLNISGLLKIKSQFQINFMDYREPPFTIQRLCELIIDYKMYTSFSKYLCAVEKMGTVTSTLPPLTPQEVIEYNKNQSNIMSSENTSSSNNSPRSPSSHQFSNFQQQQQTNFDYTTSFPSQTQQQSNQQDTDQEMTDAQE
ncbi:protein phosphatase 4 regulatory subunit 2 [Tieghemostelium lacteum]|uniref:Protein phosphatase 4 regulatory subunit 2 n=1 Tax=Tieghemostelium lacteum TaxID=361077 RepID=A0A152A3Z1_TIELA|nr:protein phosphatase 4 regulatory subunit 2 [Tieghemostelium lacteum]|eukprot:KYR00930.1 protein phosphatase 4 regulatory subunit 2 [Tieghemostelium lacteum]